MKAVLISIRPEWCDLIARGEKTLEVRKTKPKIDTPFKCYIYCTKAPKGWFWLNSPNIRRDGVVIGEFICDRVYQYSTADHLDGTDISEEDAIRMSRLTKRELEAYEFSAEQKDFCLYMIGLYCWHISDLKIYDKPKRITKFKGKCRLKNSCFGCPDWNYQMADCNGRTITRPPQSWCYVMEVNCNG